MPDPTITEVDSEYKFSGNLRFKVQRGTGIDVQTYTSLNDLFVSLGESLVKKKRLGFGQYSKKIFEERGDVLANHFCVPESDKPVTVCDESFSFHS